MDVIEYLTGKFAKEDIFKDIIGQEKIKFEIKSALISGRNVILVGPPGCGKTTFAKCIASALPDHNFVRVQGSPDLTAEDLLGDIDPMKAIEFGPTSKEAFVPGKIFKADKGVLFFDEVNRCPQKIQNSLLQVLEEKVATIGSYDVDFPANFIFVGTMNPEDTNTERLSHVFMDRFDIIYVGYPDKIEQEIEIVKISGKKISNFSEELLFNTIQFIRGLRESDKLSKHPSVRASIGLYERAQSNAFLQGRKDVCSLDISQAILSVLAHRIELKPSIKYLTEPEVFIQDEFKKYAMAKGLEISEEDDTSG